MKKFFALQFLLWVLLAGCAKQYIPTQYQYTKNQIEATAPSDEKVVSIIAPYKDSLGRIMNKVVVLNEAILSKGQPESTLGNLLADVLLEEGNLCCNKKVDFALLNNGGIRVPQLGAGEITLGKIYEVMPFENRLVLMDLQGNELQELLNSIAASGGWPISGARFIIKNKKAVDITISNAPIDENKTYTIALSDYLTEGGDNLSMLKGKPITDSGKNIREAFVDAFTRVNNAGLKLKSKLDGRIKD